MESSKRQIFLSYAAADKPAADEFARALGRAGHRVWYHAWELELGDSLAKRIQEAVRTSDLIVVLLSNNSVKSRWVERELSAGLTSELSNRAITVVPALLDDCKIPSWLSHRKYVDLRGNRREAIDRFVQQLVSARSIDLSKLDPSEFERLVADLLNELGFDVQRPSPSARDAGYDLVATYTSRDPFGAETQEVWLVEVKLYRQQRVGVSSLRQMLGYLMTSEGPARGLVVTNGQLTSVSQQFLNDVASKAGTPLRVLDGTELTNLLLQHPNITNRYFPGAVPHA